MIAEAALIIATIFTPQANSLPPCELEDGSTQEACYWLDDTGVMVINLDHGNVWFTVKM